MKVIQRFLNYQKKEFQRIRLGVFELALLIGVWGTPIFSALIANEIYIFSKRL